MPLIPKRCDWCKKPVWRRTGEYMAVTRVVAIFDTESGEDYNNQRQEFLFHGITCRNAYFWGL